MADAIKMKQMISFKVIVDFIQLFEFQTFENRIHGKHDSLFFDSDQFNRLKNVVYLMFNIIYSQLC